MMKLNSEQIEAVRYEKGPLLVIAGAGTGKTTVITERIKYLIQKELAKPSEILALTFTEKAAREMEERVDIALPYGYTQMWISTFHSFCDRILRAEALHIGLDTRYKLMSETESTQLLRSNLFRLNLDYFRPLGNPNKFIVGILQHFSRLQDEDITPTDYTRWVSDQAKGIKDLSDEEKLEIDKWKELSEVYKAYNELKVKQGLFDFGDLIVKTLKLFRDRPNILKTYQKQFKYLLVDEFQDTNYAQNELVKLLVGERGQITVVADDDQSIYRFRGAAVSNVVQFRKSFPRTKIVTLTKNYRSTQEILDRSYDLIQFNNPDRLEVVENIDKRLKAQSKIRSIPISFIHTSRVENEADIIAKEIDNLVTERKYSWGDFAILVRANNHSEPFSRALARHGIPYQFLGPGRLFRQPEIVDLISYLKVLYNFEDSVALYKVLSQEFFDISARDLAALGNFSRKYNLSLFETCEKVENMSKNSEHGTLVSEDTKEKVEKLLAVINRHLEIVKKETAGQILYYYLEDTGLVQKLLNPDTANAQRRAQNVSKFFDKLKSYEVDHDDATIPAVVDWLDLSMELGESPLAADSDWTDVDAVNILTVHSAKGLEFPVVFLVNLVSQRFPSVERREQIPIPEAIIKEVLPTGDFHLQEERRLFYVGMTRAKERLYFTAADFYGEGKREKKLSPFIFDALGDKAVGSEDVSFKGEQLSFLEYQSRFKEKVGETKGLEPVHIDYLSYSQIETFKTCPLHYKLHYIVKIPTPPSASQSFGMSMHAALKEFYESVKRGEEATEKLIYQCLERNWVKEGFSTKAHERKFFEKGKLYLSGYLRDEFDPKVVPVVMEYPFTVPLMSREKGERPIKIGGKIDRVDMLPEGIIEVVDYKTGATIPSQKEVDRNLQLSFYALAATRIPYEPYGKKPGDVKLSLYYLDSQEKISSKRSAKQLEDAVDEIFEARKEIENSEFRCSGHMFCQNNCEYSLFCKSDQES
jgi:DNA helicase-2/ATP-dependent DNA helicase PcrA